MGIAILKQDFQDWITQQWVIFFGKKINNSSKWLLGPFGRTNGIGSQFIAQLAKEEDLIIDNHKKNRGLIQSIKQLNLSKEDSKKLSKNVIDFYENTSNYDFDLKVDWNPVFKVFGKLLQKLFSNRIEQLNVPIKDIENSRS